METRSGNVEKGDFETQNAKRGSIRIENAALKTQRTKFERMTGFQFPLAANSVSTECKVSQGYNSRTAPFETQNAGFENADSKRGFQIRNENAKRPKRRFEAAKP